MQPGDTNPHASRLPRTQKQITKIAPSILAADFAALGAAANKVDQADWLHVDVMDGRFVPNITIGPPVVAALRKAVRHFLDVHLMVVEPERYVEAFAAAGADGLTVHAEACTHLHRVLQQIKSCGLQAGVALNPATPASSLQWVLEDVDLILVMTVNPGFGGQAFIPRMLDKVAEVRSMLDRAGSPALLQVDGGVDLTTAPRLAAAGARVFVAGTAVFGAPDPAKALCELQQAVALPD